MEVDIRKAIPEDHNFIVNSWLNSYYESAFAKDIKKPLFLRCHAQVVEHLLNKPSITTLVAASEDLIYGYAVYEKESPNYLASWPVFHYIYVKRAFNHFGICEKLIEASPFPIRRGVLTTHLTYCGMKLFKKLKLTYCPYML